MKKLVFWLFIVWLSFLIYPNQSFSYSAQSEKLIKAFNTQLNWMTKQKKTEYLKLITSILNEPKVQRNANANAKTLIRELWEWSSNELKKLSGSQSVSYTKKQSDWTNYQTLSNVDFDTIRTTWLNWHNEQRAKQWLDPLEYHSDLEKSANARAKTLVEKWITEWVHKRTESDWYYNYNNIKDWFNNLNIYFPKETWWKAVFSESVWYRYYKCNNWDCTQKLIESTKKVFDSFINEWSNWAHYKAIIMPHFKRIWIWFQVNQNTNMVYVVIHYAEEIVE